MRSQSLVLVILGGVIALILIYPASGFAQVGKSISSPKLSPRQGQQSVFISPHHPPTASHYRHDVSVGLFRDMFRKLKDRDGGSDGDDDDNKEVETNQDETVSSLRKDESGFKTANIVETDATVEGKSGEKKDIDKAIPFFAAAPAGSSGENESLKEDSTEANEVDTVETETPNVDANFKAGSLESRGENFGSVERSQTDIAAERNSGQEQAERNENASSESGRDATTARPTYSAQSPPQSVDEAKSTPSTQAEKLRAEAARIRLEAEKRIVELTLEKIDKLNKKLEAMKKKDTVNKKDQKEVEEELQRLKSQLVTDEKGVVQAVKSSEPSKGKTSEIDLDVSESKDAVKATPLRPTLSPEELERRVKLFEDAPEFLRILVARIAGFTVDDNTPGSVDRLNAKDIVRKLHDDAVDYDSIFSEGAVQSSLESAGSELEKARASIERAYNKSKNFDDGDVPEFSDEQIKAKLEELNVVPQFLKDFTASQGYNETDLAKMLLEEEFREGEAKKDAKKQGFFSLFGGSNDEGDVGRDGERMDKEGSGSFSRLFSGDDEKEETPADKAQSDLSFMVESLYPKSTRKEEETPDKRQVDTFVNDIVAPTRAFVPSGNPISVPGGWVIRGKNECSSGAELIEKLDKKISNDSRLNGKISFFLLKDPFPNPEEQMLDPSNWPEVIFVAGPDVCRDPAPILRTAISGLGIATAWYGSIYPFLANSKLFDRATEAMELSDAGMQVDLSWLSDMSIPLFLSFMGVQVIHDVAHRVVAGSRNIDVTIPTLVPSILSGITNSITSLRSSPKNKQDLLDFAVAGPLAGMIGSIALLAVGLVLTTSADASAYQSFPGLPLLLLRQSSLGGGLIDIFLGNGVLNVPMSAEGTQALASALIPLHPFAVAGYFSLIVNALSMIPVGRTDGGRVAMALFGRSGSQAATFVALSAMFVVGLSTSDLLLFYFAFAVFFQNELEVPCRNEVDDVDLSRLPVAGLAWFLMLLTIIPM